MKIAKKRKPSPYQRWTWVMKKRLNEHLSGLISQANKVSVELGREFLEKHGKEQRP